MENMKEVTRYESQYCEKYLMCSDCFNRYKKRKKIIKVSQVGWVVERMNKDKEKWLKSLRIA